MSVGRFMGMVGAQIWCPNTNRYLILKRSEAKDVGKGAWECGTGRVDQGEDYTTALRREVKEELGVEIQVDFIIGTEHFYRGEALPENEMLGVYYGCSLDDPDSIQLSWEHSEYRWVSLAEAEALFREGYWLLRLIQQSAWLRKILPAALLEYHHTHGFEF